MKVIRLLIIALGVVLAIGACSWLYTTIQLNVARSKGVYVTAEQGMLAKIEKHYSADRDVKILHAGPNAFDGRQPHVWFVIAEIRASSRVDGSELGHTGCDLPGSFYLQTKEGWVFVPEDAFPEFIGFWMKVFDMAGEGQSTPSTDWASGQPKRFCQ
jgi:hypothetical protein